VIGEPEDYEIWDGRRKLEDPLAMGAEYEIIARTTPGHARPADVSRPKRRSSIDLGSPSQPPSQLAKSTPKRSANLAPDTPVSAPTRSKADVEKDVPPHMRATVTYQATDATEKVWNGWYSDDDTEVSLETRVRRVLGITRSWRRLSFWRDHEGVRIVMTNKGKEVILRYQLEAESEVHEMFVSENDMPP
jgi:hypothetical protein